MGGGQQLKLYCYFTLHHLISCHAHRCMHILSTATWGPFKCYVMQCGGGCDMFRKKHYEGVWFNVISVTRGWVGVNFPEKRVTNLNAPIPALTMLYINTLY